MHDSNSFDYGAIYSNHTVRLFYRTSILTVFFILTSIPPHI